jgi:predicted ATPase
MNATDHRARAVIADIEIQGFKSYRSATLPLGPLTLLLGANASGKSNAIEAIRFLSWLASGRRLDDIMSDVQAADQLIRGAVQSLTYPDVTDFGLGCHTQLDEWPDFSVKVQVDDQGMRILDESIEGPKSTVPLYAVAGPAVGFSHEIQVQYNNFARGGIKPKIPCTDQQAVFTQLETPARFGKGHEKAQRVIPETVAAYRAALEDILFLDPSPRRMRQYSFKVEKGLKGDGSNLSSVLFELCDVEGRKDEVLEFIRSLPEQDIRDIDFVQTQRNEVMVQLTESFGGSSRTWDAPNLSDGTLRVLAVAAALLSASEGSLVIIEEMDNGVHPSRAEVLLKTIQSVARTRNLRVLLTTHNPALVDSLPFESAGDVVYCYRDPDDGSSRLTRLQDLVEYPDLIARGPLGHLMTEGVVERYVKQAVTAEQRKLKRLQWVSALESASHSPT